KTGRASAVASRDEQRARSFAARFSVPTVHRSYEELLADDSIHAVYIATVNPAHLQWVVKAAQAGKHILVEKPMGVNSREVAAMVAAAKMHDVFLMEAFMYRCHPQMQRLAELIQDGAIGEVRMIRSTFGFRAEPEPGSRLFSRELAGGAIMDVGCYPVSAARLVAGAISGKPFADPVEVKASGTLGHTGVDEHALALLKFDDGVVAQVSTSISCNLPREIVVFGTNGVITVPEPWLPSSPCRTADKALPPKTKFPSGELHLYTGNNRKQIRVDVDRDLYTYEADAVAEHIGARQSPAMSWADSEGNVRVLDEWRSQIGLRFPQDG
ncbi:MAG TPA: Gfo/Idh/MocA family oxidoreductase, partial [Gemmatimonadaceae bacterium]|nr:Gfo/Idh/MocA family oxidoreductase [Gemmatimonadaceae bacterium]